LVGISKPHFKDLLVWSRLKDRLPWYYAVSTNTMPAKYLICKRIRLDESVNLNDSSEDELWHELERLTEEFLKVKYRILRKDIRLSDLTKARPSLMDLCVELTKRMLRHCNFCRWNCRVDRTKATKYGACKLDSISRVSSYFHHLGEEIIFRGVNGSGTIFFTSCNMRCAFCQNSDISTDRYNGIPVTPDSLALMVWQLRLEGCHNINWVGGEPTIHLHTIVEAISLLDLYSKDIRDASYTLINADKGRWRRDVNNALYEGEFNAPQLWNSNFFMSNEALKILRLLMDVWLPDLKFGQGRCALSIARTPWYWETVTRNIKMVYEWDEDMVIRHLIMPSHVECCTKPVLDWIAENMKDVPINIMDQYYPDNLCDPYSPKYDPYYKELARLPSKEEILEAYRYAKGLGLNFEILSFEDKNVSGLRV